MRSSHLPAKLLLTLMLWLPLLTTAQTIVITNGVQTYASLSGATVIMSNRCELRITAAATPLSGCIINLNSTDAYLVLPNIKPSVTVSTYLAQVRINGALAVADSNCRVVQYAMGAVVVPHNASFQPLQVFSGPHFTGTSSLLSQYVYFKGTGLGAMNANISSFKLKRGYAATFAQTENGTGISKCYVAQDGDLEVSVLPGDFDNSVRFVYVTPWRWVSKKGVAGDPGNSQLNVQSWYNWNIDQNSSRDLEYVPIRQQRWWPGLGQDWKARGANTLLGYNEPDHTDQANIAVGDAIYSWPDLLATGLRLGSPAPSDGGYSSWLYPFMAQADAANLRVDFVAVHYYRCASPVSDPNAAATQMYNTLKGIYDTTKRPLWVTEWNNGANWTTCGDPTYAQQQAAVAAIINMLDTTPFVERYQLYNWVEDVRAVVTNGVLTPAGVTYRDKQSPIGYVQALPDNGTRSSAQFQFETNTLDASGFGNNGVSSGSPAYTNGHSGQALVFDGMNTVVTLPPNIANNNAFTFAAWIKWDGGVNWQRIFDFGNSTTHYMFLSPNAAGTNLRFAIRNGGSEQTVQTAMPAVDTWQHVAVTLSGTTARIFVNGTLVAQNTGMSILPSNFSPRVNFLGKSQFVTDPNFSGTMDDVLITDYALSAAQIAGLQTNTPPQFPNSSFARGTGTEGIAYNNTIAGTATDVDADDTLTYSKAVGPAWLNIATDGTMTGTPTSADGGTNYFTVRVTDAAGQSAFALVTISVTTLTASGTWTADVNAKWGETNRWSGNVVATGVGNTANFSTINITANRTVTLDSSRSIGTLRFSDTSGTQSWTITNDPGSVLTLAAGAGVSPSLVVTNTAILGTALGGTNGFTKSGPGTLILTGDNPLSGTVNIDTGSTTLSDGVVRVNGPGALENASLIQIRNNNSGTSTLQFDGSGGGITINARIGATCRNSAIVTLQNLAGTNVLNGNILIEVGGNSHTVQSDAGMIVFTGTNQYIGSLTGSRTYYFTGAGHHYLIGPIVNSTNGAPIAMTKSGTGSLTLGGVNTYANGTTLSGGSLLVNGVLPAGAFTISSGTLLGGSGNINCPVTLPAGATLAPGTGIGNLTVNNNVALQAGSTTQIELNKAAGTNDQLRVIGTLAYGGTLTVTNLNGQLWAGDSFQIFSSTTTPTGAFTGTNLPALPAGFNWNWVPTTGTLSIVATVALDPTNVVATLSGNVLELSWPADHTGWRLQVQTNTVAVGLSDNWSDVPGATTTNFVTVPVDSANGTVFYRMIFP